MVRLDLNLNEFVTIEDVPFHLCQFKTKPIRNVPKGVRKNTVQCWEFVKMDVHVNFACGRQLYKLKYLYI